jgi:hypothetical protein
LSEKTILAIFVLICSSIRVDILAILNNLSILLNGRFVSMKLPKHLKYSLNNDK